VKTAKVRYLGIIISLVTFASLFLPWWSIRASGASIDIYPFSARALNVWSQDWVIDRLLTLDDSLLTVGLLVVASGILSLVGGLKLPLLLITPLLLNITRPFSSME